MSIDPEVVPINSNEGIKAKSLTNLWYIYPIFLIFLIVFIILIKAIVQATLIVLGIYYIWRLAFS